MGKIPAMGKFRGTIDPAIFPIAGNFPVIAPGFPVIAPGAHHAALWYHSARGVTGASASRRSRRHGRVGITALTPSLPAAVTAGEIPARSVPCKADAEQDPRVPRTASDLGRM